MRNVTCAAQLFFWLVAASGLIVASAVLVEAIG
jgi:hypothetical protein